MFALAPKEGVCVSNVCLTKSALGYDTFMGYQMASCRAHVLSTPPKISSQFFTVLQSLADHCAGFRDVWKKHTICNCLATGT